MSELLQYFIGFVAFFAVGGITIDKAMQNESWVGLINAIIWFGCGVYCLKRCDMIAVNIFI